MPTLSLCLITKNEENNLIYCLESVKDVVSEIIIIDTGSTDNTIHIANRYGAQIFKFIWNDNFADARNEYLRYAKGDWILVLDADERVEADQHETLKNLIKQPSCAYNVNIYSPLSHGKNDREEDKPFHIGDYPRLFKNIKGLKYEGRIHEQILNSMIRLNISILNCDLIIQHTGYSNSDKLLPQKWLRNLRLLKKQIAEESNNYFPYYCLGSLYHEMGDDDKAIIPLEKSVILNPSKPEAHFLLGLKYMGKSNFDQALTAFKKARELKPDVPETNYNLGITYIRLKQYNEAIKPFEFLMRIGYKVSEIRKILAGLYVKIGKRKEAAKLLEEGLFPKKN